MRSAPAISTSKFRSWIRRCLYATGLAAGLGSNDIGLDRGQEGAGKIVSFERVGPRILMVQGNENFRSSSSNPAEVKSVEDSFAKSILWGFTVAGETGGRILVDASDFFLRDGHGANGGLGAAYRVDRTRTAVYLPRTKAFPKNTEIEVTVTFTNEATAGRGGGGGPNQGPPPIVVLGARRGSGGGTRRRRWTRRRTFLRHRGQRHAHRGGRHPARALFAGRTAGRQVRAARTTIRAPATAG